MSKFGVPDETKMTSQEEKFVEKLTSLSQKYHQMSVDEIDTLEKLFNKYIWGMEEVTFDPKIDLETLNLSSENYDKIYFILRTYSDELSYWKTKHDRTIKKIQNIVC